MRVEIPPYTDRWMMGDRFGVLMRVTRKRFTDPNGHEYESEIASVKLDISGKIVRVHLDHCTVR